MIVYVLFVHKKSVSKRKVCIIFIKIKNLKKPKKPPVGFCGWVFYCQPCLQQLLARINHRPEAAFVVQQDAVDVRRSDRVEAARIEMAAVHAGENAQAVAQLMLGQRGVVVLGVGPRYRGGRTAGGHPGISCFAAVVAGFATGTLSGCGLGGVSGGGWGRSAAADKIFFPALNGGVFAA
jgi:hypothetical protein